MVTVPERAQVEEESITGKLSLGGRYERHSQQDIKEASLWLRKMLANIQIKCINHTKGCVIVTSLDKIKSHEESCDFKGCPVPNCAISDVSKFKLHVRVHQLEAEIRELKDTNAKIRDESAKQRGGSSRS